MDRSRRIKNITFVSLRQSLGPVNEIAERWLEFLHFYGNSKRLRSFIAQAFEHAP